MIHPEGVPIPEPARVPAQKIHDAPYQYRGYYDAEPEGQAHVRLFSRPSTRPVIVITDLPENPTTSVTNLMETLVPEIIRDLGKTAWLEEEKPPIVIEHLPPMNPREQRQVYLSEYRKHDEYSEATFANWRPKTVWIGGRERLSLGEPDWRRMSHEEVAALIGNEEVGQPDS
jgi:hypothetical protein